jgi:hypothetical protein
MQEGYMRTLFTVLASACASLAVILAGCSDPIRPTASDAPQPTLAVASSDGSVSIISELASDKCLDRAPDAEAGSGVVISTCDDATTQRFRFTDAGELRTADGRMCVDASGGEGNDGDRVILWRCHGGANQKWSVNDDGEITGINGKCLDVFAFRTEDGTRVVIRGCHGRLNQLWDVESDPDGEVTPLPPTEPTEPAEPTVPSSGRSALPRRFLDTDEVAPTGRTIPVRAGDNLQAAINAAVPGDELVLQAGATFTGNFYLPKKSGDAWITIRADDAAGIPRAGERVSPANASRMPKLVTPNYTHALRTKQGAHHYRIVGLEMKAASGVEWNYAIVNISSGYDDSPDDFAHDIIIDRSYIHGNPSLELKRCIGLNGSAVAVIDSYLSECHSDKQDAQAIAGWNGPGPYKIVNNFLEGSAENVIFGGSDPRMANLIPSDIEIRRNHVYKPLAWRGTWMVKNLFELKNAQRVLVEGNVFENSWADGQTGFAFVLKSSNQGGRCTWCVTQDVTVRYNLVRNVAGGFGVADKDDRSNSPVTQRLTIEHNLLLDVGDPSLGSNGRLFQLLGALRDLRIVHNTGFGTKHSFLFGLGSVRVTPLPGLVIRDNISGGGLYQIFSPFGQGTKGLIAVGGADFDFVGNVVAGGSSKIMPGGNAYPASIDDVGFVNLAGDDLRLSAASSYKGKASDGTDPGADVAKLQSMIAGVVQR